MSIDIKLTAAGFEPARAAEIMREAGIAQLIASIASGPFGTSALGALALEAMQFAVDTSLAAREALHGQIMSHLKADETPSYTLPRLQTEHIQLCSAFQIVVLADRFSHRIERIVSLAPPEGEFDTEGLPALLAACRDGEEAAQRALRLVVGYVAMQRAVIDGKKSGKERDGALCGAIAGCLSLLRAAILSWSERSALAPLLSTLGKEAITIAGHPYEALRVRPLAPHDGPNLLPIRPHQIVGNEAYLRAGMRLARDVAGYDLEAGQNPKKINPILFGLGRPGCGKTVTAHAIGNAFLDFCKQREIPARFLIIQRTDWASSYQNASASNLVRIFREEVYGFDGVCGVYWPDIDTAFASRESGSLRSEEKQTLGAVFGIFDGTLLPRDGKWFMICDANTMHMDEATTSRIAQNPHEVCGPTDPAEYERLMRGLMLGDLDDHIDLDDEAWARVSERVSGLALSGRNVDAICTSIRTHVQDFDYPDAYFALPSSEREALARTLYQSVDEAHIMSQIERWAAFHKEAAASDEEARFQREVDQIVLRLNASRAAAASLGIDHE